MKTSPKPFCFVLMPFSSEFDDIYHLGIKGACEDVDVYCERVDEQIYTESMLDRIYNQISRADLIIADMTGRNANVFYEVGYAHALGKRTILMTQDAADIPFDLKHFPHVVYEKKIRTLKAELMKRVKQFAFEKTTQQEYELGLEVFLRDRPLSNGNAVATYSANFLPNATLSIFNASSTTYASGDYQIGIIAMPGFDQDLSRADVVVDLPDGRTMHLLSHEDRLFPGSYSRFDFVVRKPDDMQYDDIPITVRVFSSAGFRDFSLILREEKETSDDVNWVLTSK